MNLATFRSNLLKPSTKLRYKFLYNSTNYTSMLTKPGLATVRRDINLSAGMALVTLNNAGGWWNFLHATNNALGGTAELQVYVHGDTTNIYTLFKGTVMDPVYEGATVTLTIKDHNSRFLDKKIGSNKTPVQFYAQTYTPDHIVWSLLTNADYGGLDSTESPANTDIDYASYARWRDNHIATENYGIAGKFTGQTIAELLMIICQMTHSYIWINNSGKVEFAPPHELGFSYDEGNTGTESEPGQGRNLTLKTGLILNDVTVRRGYNFTLGTWVGSVNDTSAVSIAKFGTFAKTVEGRIIAHMTEASATSDRDDTLTYYAFPLRFFDLIAGYPALMEDLGRAITVSDTVKNISSQIAYTESILYDLNTWEIKIKARWPW